MTELPVNNTAEPVKATSRQRRFQLFSIGFVLLALILLVVRQLSTLGLPAFDEAYTSYLLLLVLLAFILGAVAQFLNKTPPFSQEWWAGFLQDTSTEMVGAIVTGLFLVIVTQPAEVRQLREDLIQRIESGSNISAVEAIDQARRERWLSEDDSLLQGAFVVGAEWGGANLRDANLQNIYLENANLQGARLEEANLTRSELRNVDLQGASLQRAVLEGALLIDIDLRGATLDGANFQNALLLNPQLDDGVALPDGVFTTLEDWQNWRSSENE
ncbi:MAG: hypothetical protein OHK0046_32790 [Anaerolineae bacterium]